MHNQKWESLKIINILLLLSFSLRRVGTSIRVLYEYIRSRHSSRMRHSWAVRCNVVCGGRSSGVVGHRPSNASRGTTCHQRIRIHLCTSSVISVRQRMIRSSGAEAPPQSRRAKTPKRCPKYCIRIYVWVCILQIYNLTIIYLCIKVFIYLPFVEGGIVRAVEAVLEMESEFTRVWQVLPLCSLLRSKHTTQHSPRDRTDANCWDFWIQNTCRCEIILISWWERSDWFCDFWNQAARANACCRHLLSALVETKPLVGAELF